MLTIWHNPRCRKSRETLALLESSGKAITIRKYLEDAPSVKELTEILNQLGFEDPRALMRRGKNPILIERPVVTNGQEAVLGRPPEAVKAIL